MMKKNGFTLAEVLITLAIIGVVATITLPALMTNTQEQQSRTALKKGINTLTESAQMNQAIDGFDDAIQGLYKTLNRTSVIHGNLAKTNSQRPTDLELQNVVTFGIKRSRYNNAMLRLSDLGDTLLGTIS